MENNEDDTGTMTHEDIDKWSKMYNLQGEEIFQLDAEFESLMLVEKQELERRKLKATGKLKDDLIDSLLKKDKQIDEHIPEDTKKGMFISDGPSIALWVFLKYTNSLSDKFKSVQLRLISAFGVDITNENVRINWTQFLLLKRFLELFVSSDEECQDIWIKAIDNRGTSTVHEDDFVEFIENLARGCMNADPTSVSINFAEQMLNMLKVEGCCNSNTKQINIGTLRQKIKVEKTIDIEVFNQLLRQNIKPEKTMDKFKQEILMQTPKDSAITHYIVRKTTKDCEFKVQSKNFELFS